MSFDRASLITACRAHSHVVRVVVASVKGSAPREVGASMLVWADGFEGTIGGGTLEFEALAMARTKTPGDTMQLTWHALGPDLGQCCGGAVELLTECFDLSAALAVPDDLYARGPDDMPLSVSRAKGQHRGGNRVVAQFIEGWMVEPISSPRRDIWVWGAGHVGRALVDVLHPLPDVQLTWIDTGPDRFPEPIPSSVEHIVAANPGTLVGYAPPHAEHLIVTYSHTLDLELCHQLLSHAFDFAGLIGSATKWARFKSRLADLGHGPDQIARITCPIGRPALGKHPHVIALGVAGQILEQTRPQSAAKDTA